MFSNMLSPIGDRFLFNSNILVKIMDDSNRISSLRLQIHRPRDSLYGPNVIYINLFDDNDPYVAYSAEINDEIFQRLKIQQHLLIDFISFPQRLVDLLRLCGSDSSLDANRYQSELRPDRLSSAANLDITEINGFKKIVHLSIRLNQADESHVRQHMLSAFAHLKQEKERLEAAVKANEMKSREQQAHYERQLDNLKAKFEHELQQSNRHDIRQQMDRLTLEHSELESTLRERLRNAEEQISTLQLRNTTLESRLREAQTETQQLQLRMDKDKESNRLIQERLDCLTRTDPGKENSDLRLKIAQLNVDLETAKTDVCKLKMDNRRLEESLEHKQGQVDRREAGIKTMSDDILKANDIIQKLQAEIKTYHSKLKVRSDVIVKQEEIIESKEKELRNLRDQASGPDKENAKIQQLEKQLDHKDNVIQWLNKKLNELQGHKVDTPLMTAPSPLQENNPPFARHLSNRPSW